MAIQATDIQFYLPATVSDASSNGGRMSANALPAGMGNLFPYVPQAERLAGSTKYRKLFAKVAPASNQRMVNAKVFLNAPTPGDDRVLIFPGVQTDTQNALTGAERLYGAGTLDVTISAGATTLAVNCEAADQIFRNGDLIRICDQTSISDANGHEEFLRVASTSGVSWNGSKATLTLSAGVSTAYGYAGGTARVSSVIEVGYVIGSWDNWGGSTVAGTYAGNAPATPPTSVVPTVDSIGGVEQVWTLVFTSPTTFACTGDTLGAVGSGSTGNDFSPANAIFSRPYFSLPSAGWGGTWATGDVLTFRTHPSSVPVWTKRIVPAGANSLSNNYFDLMISGESA
ncbi:MAG: hypothetical protein HQL66_00740 [Magnetococcales bacterium]|nr:hypothetical protein [Magnetococcales bacterium]